jgi:hypothetical protein
MKGYWSMRGRTLHVGWAGPLLLVLAAGCSKTTEPPPADQEGAVRERFAELQAVLVARDADKLWVLLADRSRADAERAARGIQEAYSRAGPEAKAEQEKALGLTGAELAGLTGKGFLKTKPFQGKYHEVPDSKIERVEVQGDNATVRYLEPDGDKEKLIFIRQGGQWKVWLTVPKVSQPGPEGI